MAAAPPGQVLPREADAQPRAKPSLVQRMAIAMQQGRLKITCDEVVAKVR